MSTYKLAVIGGGNMGTALVQGLIAKGRPYKAEELVVIEVLADRRAALADQLPKVHVLGQLGGTLIDAAIIAVKPADVPAAARAATEAGALQLLSVAAGVPTAAIENAAGATVRVVRAMPNTPALVGAGVAAIAPGQAAREQDLAWAESILTAVGTVVRVPERALDAVTGLSGSGPAYLFLVAEALIDAGVLTGLPRDTSEALVRQLFVGAARLLEQTGESPAELRARVTSPAGTTAAGLHQLERAAVRAAFVDAVSAATARSRELGRS